MATRLVALASEARLFRTPDDDAYARFIVKDHWETAAIRSRPFRNWLTDRLYEAEGKAPNAPAMNDALNLLEARARHGPTHPVFVRVGERNGTIYLDLANDEWEAVEISPKIRPKGWRIIKNPPVRFKRPRGMLPLPHPTTHGSIDLLRPFLNLSGDETWVLIVGVLLAAFRPRGPHPLLIVHGEQGSGKSTTSRILGKLIDPHTVPLRSVPKDQHDLMIAAKNSWLLVFDNVSHLPGWFSDALCRLSTGGGMTTRALYTDTEEVFLDAERPVILNGIGEIATRPDLLDRGVIDYLPPIPGSKRLLEDDFWKAFERVRPRILGALLKAVSTALRRLPRVHLDNAPRMADLAAWITAAEPALGWPPGTFLKAYRANIEAAQELALEFSLVATAIEEFVERVIIPGQVPGLSVDLHTIDGTWVGTATELRQALEDEDPSRKRQRGWPRSPAALSNALRRLAPGFRTRGIQIEFDQRWGHDRRRLITIRTNGESVGRVGRQAAPTRQEADADPLPPLPDIVVDAVDAVDAAEDLPLIFPDTDPAEQGGTKTTGTPPPRPGKKKRRRRSR